MVSLEFFSDPAIRVQVRFRLGQLEYARDLSSYLLKMFSFFTPWRKTDFLFRLCRLDSHARL
jgi:hypothetical protein